MLRKHAKLKDTRTDFLHKLSTEIIRENQTIILEDLFAKHSEGNVSGMIKKRCYPATTPVASGRNPAFPFRDCRERSPRHRNADQERERAPRDRKLSRSISDLGWRQFRT
ncbi:MULTISPECIES: transposase [unclassified Okeania]|uniref:transposase n=1 Tax=unclassified Okeania TaxID=2634635 RepID=UPI00338D6415